MRTVPTITANTSGVNSSAPAIPASSSSRANTDATEAATMPRGATPPRRARSLQLSDERQVENRYRNGASDHNQRDDEGDGRRQVHPELLCGEAGAEHDEEHPNKEDSKPPRRTERYVRCAARCWLASVNPSTVVASRPDSAASESAMTESEQRNAQAKERLQVLLLPSGGRRASAAGKATAVPTTKTGQDELSHVGEYSAAGSACGAAEHDQLERDYCQQGTDRVR